MQLLVSRQKLARRTLSSGGMVICIGTEVRGFLGAVLFMVLWLR
jgi:hypothetical protein